MLTAKNLQHLSSLFQPINSSYPSLTPPNQKTVNPSINRKKHPASCTPFPAYHPLDSKTVSKQNTASHIINRKNFQHPAYQLFIP
jgi:hypothetical protein